MDWKLRLSIFVAMLAFTITNEAGHAQSQEIKQPKCKITGNISKEITGSARLYSDGVSSLHFDVPLTNIQLKGVTLTPDHKPFLRIYAVHKKSGQLINAYGTYYVGEAFSEKTNQFIGVWKHRYSMGNYSAEHKPINIRKVADPRFPDSFFSTQYGVGMTDKDKFLRLVASNSRFTSIVENNKNKNEKISIVVDNQSLSMALDAMLKQVEIFRDAAKAGKCRPV